MRTKGRSRHELVFGARRFRAAKLAGLDSIPGGGAEILGEDDGRQDTR